MNNAEIKIIEVIVNSEQARKRLDELSQRLVTMKQKREEALNMGDSKGIGIYTNEIKKIEREMKRAESSAITMRKALDNLDKSAPKALKETLKVLNRELNSGKVERGSLEWEVLTKAIRKTNNEIRKVKEETKKATSWSIRLQEWGNKWMGITTTLQGLSSMYTSLRESLLSTVNI